jgi:hypothetical protein
MGGGWVYGAIPRKAVQVMLIYKEFSQLHRSVFVMRGLHVPWLYLSRLGTRGI